MPGSTILDLSCSEQEQLLFELRRSRYGYWLALHIILLCAAGYTPTHIAAVLFCSRSSVYRAVKAYRAGLPAAVTDAGQTSRRGSLTPSVRRSLFGTARQSAVGFRLVSHALELRHPCRTTARAARGSGLGRYPAALPAPTWLGLETRQTRRTR